MKQLRVYLCLIAVLSGPPAWACDVADKPGQAVVASARPEATDAGLEILAAGGNAFDAAVAVSAVLGLVEPESSGLGGGGFFLLRDAKSGHEVFVDARERAPFSATRDMFLDGDGEPIRRKSIDGVHAAGIPGLAAGLVHVAERYGRLPLSRSLRPAIRLAEQGWAFGSKNRAMLGYRKEVLAADAGAAKLFLIDGEVPQQGQLLRNPDYAKVLRRIVEHGHAGFYEGDTAKLLIDGVNALGGAWSKRDFDEYSVVEREPLRFRYHGYQLVTAPPPSSGGVALAGALQILDGIDMTKLDAVTFVHVLTETMRRVYRDRAEHLGDPDFHPVPVDRLMSLAHARDMRAEIDMQHATPSSSLPAASPALEREETTHFSIIDADGNLAAVTQTVNLPYGNAVVVPGTGFLLNNEMDDFSMKPGVPNAFGLIGGEANAIAPGKRPLSSMSPTFMIGEDQVAVLGTPGGSRIISMVLLGILELDDGATAQQAAAAPRIHHQYMPDVLSAEPGALTPEVIEGLRAMGHTVEVANRTWGNMHVARWNRCTGDLDAGADPRGVGSARVGKAGSEAAIFE